MKFIMFLSLCIGAFTISEAQQNNSPCSHPKFHEFDFWIGTWNVYKHGTDTLVGTNTIMAVAGDCAIQENWKNVNGSNIGTSLNKYAYAIGKWQQFWVDNSGLTLLLEGNMEGNNMVLKNEKMVKGQLNINRITWFNNADGTVRQLWESSTDGGITFSVAFDGLYKRQ